MYNMPSFQLDPKLAKRFLAGYPWIYTNEFLQTPDMKDIKPGELVKVCYQNNAVAIGYFNRHSLICFRVLSRNPLDIINCDFFCARLREALQLREAFYSKPFYRLIHAESDAIPGVIVDRFDSVFVVQINTQGMHVLKDIFIAALQKTFDATSIYVRQDTAVRTLEGLPILEAECIGAPISELKVLENDTNFVISLENSQKTGWFFDHRDNRRLIAELAKDKEVLDYFCYSGGFAIQAAKAGAKKVIGIDRAEQAIQNAKHSAKLNQVDDKCEFVVEETFADMELRIQRGEKYDIVVLDPPAFMKSKKDLAKGLKGYEKLLSQGMKLVKGSGFLFFASCSFHSNEMDLQFALTKALAKNHRQGKIIKRVIHGFDHPIHPFLKEAEYLKGFLVSF